MHTEDIQEHGAVLLVPAGRLDGTVAPVLEKQLTGLVEAGASRVVMDLCGVDYISSAGLLVLRGVQRQLCERHGILILCGMSGPVRQVFDLSGFLPLFAVEPSREAAFARLGRA